MRAAALGGTCHELAHYDFEAWGKTGTAQNRGHDHSVFMGFAPMDNPKIAVAVYVENGGWGATFGVPIGGLIMEQYIHGKLSEASLKKAETIQHKVINYGNTER
jgi:penicillin-binding protein 2